MTQAKARKILEKYLLKKADFHQSLFPVYDEVIHRETKRKGDMITMYSFLFIVKTAFDLKENS